MGIRDWLAIIVIIFIVLILLDGFRRKWFGRKTRIVMKLDKKIPRADDQDDSDPLTSSELPGGGARIVTRDGAGGGFRGEDSRQEEGALGEDVPVLMDSVNIDDGEIEEFPQSNVDADSAPADAEPTHASVDVDEDGEEREGSEEREEEDIAEEAFDDAEPEASKAADSGRKGRGEEGRIEPTFGDSDMTFGRDDQGELSLEDNNLFENAEDDESAGEEEPEVAGEVLIINVMARQGQAIEGEMLLPVLLKQGMRLGDMSIFHRHADASGKGPVMFSMANMLKPGTFNMGEMEEIATPGISFFMQLPNKLGNMQCFEQMLKTATAVRDALDAQLKDENRSVFTRQTVEHSRQRIRDFELEMLARK